MTPILDNLLGVVLCGGESRRMGRDKGLLPAGDTIWALSTAAKLTPFGIPVLFSVSDRQLDNYSSYISPDRLITDSIAVNGPLKGLLSVHKKFPDKDLLLMACDMRDLDRATIQKMITAYRQITPSRLPTDSQQSTAPGQPMDSLQLIGPTREEQYDFFVYQDQGFAQPFCGIYTAGGLSKAYASVLRPDPHGLAAEPDFSLQSILNKGNTKRLEIDRMEAFRNYNS